MPDPANIYRDRTIRDRLLQVLDATSPQALPEAQLLIEVNHALRPEVDKAEFDDAVNFLCVKKFIRSRTSALDDQIVEWFITEEGQNLINQ